MASVAKLPDLLARTDGLCAIADCDKRRHGVKVCAMHYERWRVHGSFELPPKIIRPCLVEGCSRGLAHSSRGLCSYHYQRWWKHGRHGISCVVESCGLNATVHGLCDKHYRQLQRHGRIYELPQGRRQCSIEGCDSPYLAMGYCRLHYKRWQANGDAAITQRFHGQGSIDNRGYRRVPAAGHANAHSNGQIAEHRLVMSRLLGRPLLREESVHHKNGNRLDNRAENLELWVRGHGAGQRVEDQVRWAEEILTRYGGIAHQFRLFDLKKEA